MLYLGIDPGVSGGWACLTEDRQVVMGKWLDVVDTRIEIQGILGEKTAMIEEVHSSPQMGVRSAFTFGVNRGMWEAILSGLLIPFERIRPLKWQTELRCRSKGDKNVTKRRAQELYPQIASHITHATADALLIAEYCLRTRGPKRSAT